MNMGNTVQSFEPLRRARDMAAIIAEVTGAEPENVLSRLRREATTPCISVIEAFAATGLPPYVWSDGLSRFYAETDCFLYELALWNRNPLKQRLREQVADILRAWRPGPLDVLSIGDGLGFDCLHLASEGHRVTYFEQPCYQMSFARRLFAAKKAQITILSEHGNIVPTGYDVVVCLDVLEHVPDPESMVRSIASYIRPGGLLIVHAPFYLIHPAYPVHLAANRRYSGDLKIYSKFGLEPIESSLMLIPIVLRKRGESAPSAVPVLQRLRISLASKIVSLARFSSIPAITIHHGRCRFTTWFEE